MPEDKRQVGITLYGPALDVNPVLLWLVHEAESFGYLPELTEVRDDDDGQGRTACLYIRWPKP